MTFKQWMKRYLKDDTPIGDLARDVYTDASFPETSDHGEMIYHLLRMDAHSIVMELFDEAYEMYKQE